jgi:hypothetical protein
MDNDLVKALRQLIDAAHNYFVNYYPTSYNLPPAAMLDTAIDYAEKVIEPYEKSICTCYDLPETQDNLNFTPCPRHFPPPNKEDEAHNREHALPVVKACQDILSEISGKKYGGKVTDDRKMLATLAATEKFIDEAKKKPRINQEGKDKIEAWSKNGEVTKFFAGTSGMGLTADLLAVYKIKENKLIFRVIHYGHKTTDYCTAKDAIMAFNDL